MEGNAVGEEVPVPVPAAAAIVKSIFIYPIKSCRGISVSQAPISPTGFVWDRQWLVVNSKGRGVTQRVEPKLALVEVELPDEAFLIEEWKPSKNSYLVLKAPGMKEELKVPLMSSTLSVCDGISCWEWSGSALDEGDEASNWLSTFLGKPNYRLVRFNNADQTRPVDPDYGSGHKVMFSDQYPFLLISQGSLNALNSFLKDPLPINRFRPNIFVDGCEAFAEDLWKEVRINNTLSFAGVKLCSRCKVPTIDQETAIAGTEPTLTLQTFRSGTVLRPAHERNKGLVYFGQNLVCNNSFSSNGDHKMILKVGDPVSVIQALASTNDAPA
ncbi:mitochondrial amidoxime reducing component 2 [Impatiens glandulifera]|uniref:mitochondrial amidoxime reducing component 2 n=1 Tax=Impatiens glandulifera TaxID=253017 RepID=UPI001FB18BBB|nr:mitochondrial amidoxime reducing component 2 [Impatiens glandulifera]